MIWAFEEKKLQLITIWEKQLEIDEEVIMFMGESNHKFFPKWTDPEDIPQQIPNN